MDNNAYELSSVVSSSTLELYKLDTISPHTAGQHVDGKANTDKSAAQVEFKLDGSKEAVYDIDHSDETPDLTSESSCFSKGVTAIQKGISFWYTAHKATFWTVIYVTILLLWIAYVAYAMYYNFKDGFDPNNEPGVRLMSMNVVAVFCVGYWLLKKSKGDVIYAKCLKPIETASSKFLTERWHIIKWVCAVTLTAAITTILVVDIGLRRPENLYSAIGLAVYITLLFVFSSNPSKVRWRPVIWGLILQFSFAYIILRTCWGYTLFEWLGDRVQEFLEHTDEGSKFVFGETTYTDHFFAFKVLPVIIFFSTIISMLYYLGWMQVVIQKIAWVMQVTMGTTAGESLNAAANIFVGQTEAPLIIKPLLQDMTRSELHAIMTGGFATIAGSVLATYILYGVPANHLLSASVMSAPAALAVSKLFYPETEKSKTTLKDIQNIQKGPERSLIEAASAGASVSVSLVANIAANLIAFLAVKQFFNETLKWFGAQVGLAPPYYPDFTFEFICSYVLWPFAWVMGVDFVDCGEVASLIGVKTFTNEFVAYTDLSKLIANRGIIHDFEVNNPGFPVYRNESWNCYHLNNGTYSDCLKIISERSEVISIYALCGFANLGSIGIMIGGLGELAPARKRDLIAVVVRAMIAGNVACFMTACIAGLLVVSYEDQSC